MNWKFILLSLLFFAMAARANANIVTEVTDETLIYGTDTFESADGNVLSTAQYVYWGGEIPPDIANDIATDPAFSASDPAAQSFIQSTASEAALTDDLDFLIADAGSTNQLPDVFYTTASSMVYTGSFINSDPLGDFSAAFPAFAITSRAPVISIGIFSYSTGAIEPSGDFLEGTDDFDTYEIDLVEQPASVPEPSVLALCASAGIIYGRRMKRRKI